MTRHEVRAVTPGCARIDDIAPRTIGRATWFALLTVLGAPGGVSGQWQDAPAVAGLSGAEVRAVEVASDGVVWLAVRDRGLARIQDNEVEWVGSSDGLVSDNITRLREDRSARLWAAGAGGISVLETGEWASHRTLGTLEPRVVFDIHEATRSGTIWFAAAGGAGYRTGGGWSLLVPARDLPHSVVHAVVVDGNDVAWLACRRGLARVEDGRVEVFFPDVNFRSAALADDGTLWFGTPEGIYTWDGRSWTRHHAGEPTYPLRIGRDGTVWAGTLRSRMLRFDGTRWSEIALPERLAGAEIFDLEESPDGGAIWVATAAGAGRFLLTPEGS